MNTEQIARDTVAGLFTELAELMDHTNDDNLAAWEMARAKGAEVYHAIDTVCVQQHTRRGHTAPSVPREVEVMLHRPAPSTREFLEKCPGFLEAVSPEQVLDPATEAAFDELEAQAVDRAHPIAGLHPVMSDLMSPFVQRRGA